MRFAKRHSMLEGSTGIVVAVSGGPDSVAMLDMLVVGVGGGVGVGGWGLGAGGKLLTNPQPPTPNPHLHIAHLDHMLRERESAEDAEFVRALAERIGLPATIRSTDVRAIAESSKRGIEEVAREVRYEFLVNLARETGCDRIAVGHTMNDQAETVLMRLIRGTGLRGLAAMRPVSAAHTFSSGAAEEQRRGGAEGPRRGGAGMTPCSSAPPPLFSSAPLVPSAPLLIRPLLCITREEVEEYCRERGLEFRTDASNASLDYTRNLIRREVIPALREINSQAVVSIARAAENLASEEEVLAVITTSVLSTARIDALHNEADCSVQKYSVEAFLEHPPGLRRRMIIEAIKLVRRESATGEITSKHVSEVESLLQPQSSGKHVCLPDQLEVWREFDAIVFKTNPINWAYEVTLDSTHTEVEAGGFAFTIERPVAGHSLKSVVAETQQVKRSTGQDWMVVALDDREFPTSLIIRPRMKGERAHVVGQRKTKKLKNLMIEHRIPSSRRATWPVVTTPDGDYIWSPGLPPSAKFAAHDEIPSLAILRASIVRFQPRESSGEPQWEPISES
ncbi:MAG TPA: tRNA lysidine(34) synthetase TilS [Blastocatellia bacterium]|nr:tRNA lysidine(34) synthetase TilS [Blastocatellia bacterium]